MQKTISPIVKWSQRKENVFLTVDVRDLKDEKVDLTATSLKFSANAEGVNYTFELNFFADVSVEESKWTNYGLNVRFILSKKDKNVPYWVRLIKENQKLQYLQVDWPKYIDEEDEGEEGGKGLDDWNADKFQGFDGQGGQQQDEDDEDEGEGEGEGEAEGEHPTDNLEEPVEVPQQEQEKKEAQE